MKTEKRKYTATLLTDFLGTLPKDPEVYKRFIATKDDEIELANNIDYVEKGGWTTFAKNDSGEFFLYDYMIKGFLKAACEVLMATGDIKKIIAYKKWFDKLVFVWPRQISLGKTEPDLVIERPLRGITKHGPIVTVLRSDAIAAGSKFEFEIELITNDKKITWDVIEKCLGYGKYYAFGQWRGSGGYGRAQFSKLNYKNK